MTNKVKPFYIRITGDMTPQIALEVKDKCTNKNVSGDFHFNPSDIKRWKYLGVCSQDGLCYSDFTENFYGNSQEITLDQLDEWLGLGVKQEVVEWRGGDECVVSTKSKSKWFVVGTSPITETSTVCISNTGELKSFHTSQLKKPETPKQKAEREKKEAEEMIQCLLDNYNECDDSAIEYVIDYLKECESLGR